MGISNVLLSIAEIKDLHNNAAMDLNLLHQIQNPRKVVTEKEITTATLGGLDAVANEDNEGFKTPPLMEKNRILSLKECPPAPRKRKLPVMSPPVSTRRVILLDYSDEVEAMFPLAIRKNFYGKFRKVGDAENSKNDTLLLAS